MEFTTYIFRLMISIFNFVLSNVNFCQLYILSIYFDRINSLLLKNLAILELCLMLVSPFRTISIRFTNNVVTISVIWHGQVVFFLSRSQLPSQMPPIMVITVDELRCMYQVFKILPCCIIINTSQYSSVTDLIKTMQLQHQVLVKYRIAFKLCLVTNKNHSPWYATVFLSLYCTILSFCQYKAE